MIQAEKPLCGGCLFFDPFDVDKQPIGTITVDGILVRRGVCRTRGGLAMSVGRNEASPCGQPEGTYKPRRTKGAKI